MLLWVYTVVPKFINRQDYLVLQISTIKINNFCLYRDDRLTVVKNTSGLQSKKIKKELRLLSKEFVLNLTIECNKARVDYLDITLNLLDGTQKLYQKPENIYMRKPSNHPPKIEQIVSAIETHFKLIIRRDSLPSCSRRL